MLITKLFNVRLPTKSVSLSDRIEQLRLVGVHMSICARNFISPPFLQVTIGGERQLYGATFKKRVTTEDVLKAVRSEPVYGAALIEDFLQALCQPSCEKTIGSALACPGALFTPPFTNGKSVTPYAQLGTSTIKHFLEFAPEEAIWSPGVVFLLAKKK